MGHPMNKNEFEEIGRASKKTAWITILGAAIVVLSIIYAYLNLNVVDRAANKFSESSEQMAAKLEEARIELESTRTQLKGIQDNYASAAVKEFRKQVCSGAVEGNMSKTLLVEQHEKQIRSLVNSLVNLGLNTELSLGAGSVTSTKEAYTVLQEQLKKYPEPQDECLSYYIDNASIRELLSRPPYKSCSHPSHGIETYKYQEIVTNSSGWVSGGRDQNWWCATMKNSYQASRNQAVTWKDQRSSEQSKKDWLGHVEYKYLCTATALWEPIYKEQASKYCREDWQ
jgi:hypothetical protein